MLEIFLTGYWGSVHFLPTFSLFFLSTYSHLKTQLKDYAFIKPPLKYSVKLKSNQKSITNESAVGKWNYEKLRAWQEKSGRENKEEMK